MDENPSVKDSIVNQLSIDRISLLKSRLEVAKAWCRKPHEAMKKWIAEYEIENFDDTAEIRDKVRIGYIFRKTENENAAIFDDQPDLFLKGKNKDNQVVEDVCNGGYDYLWDKQNLEEKIEDVGVYFELLGIGAIGSPWKTKTKKVTEIVDEPLLDETGQPVIDQMGQPVTQQLPKVYEVPVIDRPDAEVKNIFKLFFSPETKFNYVMDTDHCPYYFEEMSWVKEKVKARFGKDVDANEKMHTTDTDADSQIDTEYDKKVDVVSDDLQRVTVYEYYGTLPERLAKGIKDAEGKTIEWEWDKEYHIYMTKNEELLVEECPYPIKPLFMVGLYGLANKFWKFGDAKHLMPLVQELEMYRSQILQHTRKMANPKPLLEMNSEVDEQAFNDPRVGKSVKYLGTPPQYLSPANLGNEVAVGVEMVRTDLEKTSPSFDLSGGGGQSQVKSPRGIATYAEAADKGTRRKRKKIARFIKQLITFQLLQLGMNWTPDNTKTLSIAGKDEPVTEEVLTILKDDDLLSKLDIEIESLSLNRVQMREEATSLWDIAIAAPQIFNLQQVAKDLVQNGFHKRDADRYLVSMDQMNTQAIQGFLQQLAAQNPELANAVMQYVNQPNVQELANGQPQEVQDGVTPPPEDTGLAAPQDMQDMGGF